MRKNKFSSKVSDDTTLVIATYNRPVFLELALKGVLRRYYRMRLSSPTMALLMKLVIL